MTTVTTLRTPLLLHPDTMGRMIEGLHTTWCQVADMDRAVTFYRDVLGLKADMVTPYWSQFDLGNGKIALHPAMAATNGAPLGNPGAGWFLGIQTSDIRALRAKLNAAGVTIRGDYHDTPPGVVLTFSDLDGNPIQAIQLGLRVGDMGG